MLNKLPVVASVRECAERVQPKAKSDIHDIWQAETREEAGKAFDPDFTIQRLEKYEPKFPAACECLGKVRDVLQTFYDFPAEPRLRDEAGSPENHEPHRIYVRHNPPETPPH